jgi:hypothetical protein
MRYDWLKNKPIIVYNKIDDNIIIHFSDIDYIKMYFEKLNIETIQEIVNENIKHKNIQIEKDVDYSYFIMDTDWRDIIREIRNAHKEEEIS